MTPIRFNRWVNYIACIVLLAVVVGACKNGGGKHVIGRGDIENYSKYRWLDDSTKFPLTGNITIYTKPYALEKGKYSLQIRAYGTKGENRLPRLIVGFGPYELKVLDVDVKTAMYFVNFELPEDVNDKFVFTFNDDYNSDTEDRNVFMYFPVMLKRY